MIVVLIIVIIAVFLIHQITKFYSKPAPKIKFSAVEKYKSLLENAAVAAAAAAAAKTSSPPPPPQTPQKIELLDITDEFADDITVYDEEMEQDLLRAVSIQGTDDSPTPFL
jgi:hypothetical protein